MPLSTFDVLDQCEKTSSTSEKRRILEGNTTPQLKNTILWALNPYYTFGIKQFAFANPLHNEDGDLPPSIFDDLANLRDRKITGNLARLQVYNISATLSRKQQEVLRRILSKDLRCGIAEGIVNRAYPNLVPEFEIQLAAPPKNINRIEYPCLAQPKYDGVRVIALVDPGSKLVTYYSRKGKEFLNFNCFDNELLSLSCGQPKMFDGEVVGSPGDSFRGIMKQCRRKYDVEPKGLSMQVFDWMPTANFTSRNWSELQEDRSRWLEEKGARELGSTIDLNTRRVFIVQGTLCNNYEELSDYFDQCVSQGYEGLVVKNLTSRYEFKRSCAWIKIKPTITEDLKVIDVKEGQGKYIGKLGAFVVLRNGIKVRVGSKLSDAQRIPINDAHRLIGVKIEVCFDSVTPDGSLRFPRFLRYREDK